MEPPLDNARHLRYWQRCLRTLLPHQYTANDSTRMTLGCFAVAAVDLLTPPSSSPVSPILSPTDRRNLRAWVLSCQHPGGGFAGGPTHVYPQAAYDGFDFVSGQSAVGARGEANIAATLFALQLLALLADDGSEEKESGGSAFAGVNRPATLRWLRQLQREDGSFGEILADVVDPEAPGGRRLLIAGGSDARYCYIAAMIRWVLRGDVGDDAQSDAAWVEDINVDALVRYIRSGQTYDGGFAESSAHESHAGYAFCAIAALSLLERPVSGEPLAPSPDSIFSRGVADLPALLRWLECRSFLYKPTGAEDGGNGDDEEEEEEESVAMQVTPDSLVLPESHPLLGFNGRCNKHADTCYTWWAVGTLVILIRHGLIQEGDSQIHKLWEPSRRFLLEETQHTIGGFSKGPRGPPDIYHSYLGLAALATHGEPTLRSFDAAACVSASTVQKIEAARKALLRGTGQDCSTRRATFLQMAKAACRTTGNDSATSEKKTEGFAA